jgi:hypothetical protein
MTTLAKIPAGLDLAATVGSDLIVAVTVNENDAPYDFTSNTIGTAIFNQDGTTSATNFTTSTLNNVLTLTLSDTATTALGADSFTWELRVTKDDTVSPWLAGTLSVVPRGAGGTSLASTTLTLTTAPSVNLSLAVGFGVIPDAEAVPFNAVDPLTETNVQDAVDELAAAVQARIPTVKSSVYIEDNAVATLVDQNVAAKVLGTFLPGPNCMACTVDSNRITYIGTRNTRVLAIASVDVDGPNNQTYVIELRRNGELVDGLRSKVRKGTQVASGSIVGHIPLTTNDYVELWITNTTSGDNPVVSDATFALMN